MIRRAHWFWWLDGGKIVIDVGAYAPESASGPYATWGLAKLAALTALRHEIYSRRAAVKSLIALKRDDNHV